MKITVIPAAPEESFEQFCERNELSLVVRERRASLRKGRRDLRRWSASFEPFVEIAERGMLRSVHGNGDTPDEAIFDLSKSILSSRLVVGAYQYGRRECETPETWKADDGD